MAITKSVVTKSLGIFNGIVIGTVFGIAAYVQMTTGVITLSDMLSVAFDVGGYAVGASSATPVTSRVTKYPLGTVLAGALGGFVGAVLAIYVPLLTSAPLISNIVQQLITGLVAGGVIGILTRLLPGL